MPDAERLLKFSFYNYFCMAYSKLCVFNSASLFSNRKTGIEAPFHLPCHKKVFSVCQKTLSFAYIYKCKHLLSSCFTIQAKVSLSFQRKLDWASAHWWVFLHIIRSLTSDV